MLKTYLQALLSRFYSKKENSVISNLSTPRVENYISNTFKGNASYTCPADGFVCLVVSGRGVSSWRRLSLVQDNIEVLSNFQTEYFASGWHRVSKGQVVKTTAGEGVDGQSVTYVLNFAKSMGGVIQSLTRFFKGACYA